MTVIPGATLKRWAWTAVPAIGAALIGAYFLLPTGSIEQAALYEVIGLATVAAALIGLRHHRPAGWQPWLLMVAGQSSFVVGDIIWTIFEAQGQDPFPSAADGAYLFGYPLIAMGLLMVIRRRITGGDRAGLLDAAILTTGSAVAWWAFVLGPLVAAGDPDPLSFAISIAYPIGDLLLIGMALGLVMTPGARSTSFRLLIGTLILTLIADLVFGLQSMDGTYFDGSWLDALWLFAYVTFATAVVHPSMEVVFEPRPVSVTLLSPVRLVLLAGAMLVGPAILAIGRTNEEAIVLVVAGASAVLSILVLTRLAGMVRHLDRDIERRKSLELQLSYQAFHDPLTGLTNRRRFVETVAMTLATGSATAALFLDLDDLKDVNDAMGHDAGDVLLTAVGHRIAASVRPNDLAARLGGDEFAVLLPDVIAIDEAAAIAARLLDSLSAPFEIEGTIIHATVSVGIAVRPVGEPMTVDDLLRRADVAMYHAKARGKHRAAIYSPELERTAPPTPTVRGSVSPATSPPFTLPNPAA